MKQILSFVLTFALCTGMAVAQFLPPTPSLEKDEKGAFKKMDFSIALTGISDPGILFSHFGNRPLYIYYYSPKCPHCQLSYPKFQALAKQFEPKGLQAIVISVSGVKKNDIRMFMDQHNVQLPMFQDGTRKFSDLYGSGHVPMQMIVYPNGQYIRYTENNADTWEQIKKEFGKMLDGK